MATSDTNLADRSGNLLESHKNYDPRIVFFYFLIAALLIVLGAGLAYQQLTKVGEYSDRERQQNQRRVLFPGPRGNIFDREGRILVENKHRFAVLLHLDELKAELRREQIRIYKNFVDSGGKKEAPTSRQLQQLARVSLVQRYLDQVNAIIGRTETLNAGALQNHFNSQLLLPFTLLDDLDPTDYARLIERLPVKSPLEVYASHVRSYPYGSAAAHTLGYVRPDTAVDAEGFPGEDLTTFKMKGTSGRDGLEKWFDDQLQGEAGGRIYRVDPSGYKINPPLEVRLPKQGKHLTTSLDIDLQHAAEEAIADQTGAAIALDVNTGEVLVLASKPDYDLNKFSPRASADVVAQMNERGAWNNYALNGFFPPGSTFKILTSIAGLRSGVIEPEQPIAECVGVTYLGRRAFVCDNRRGQHGHVLLREAIAKSCDIYYYEVGKLASAEVVAAEGRRFHLHQPVGIELPNEQRRMIMPDPDWKKRFQNESWVGGDTYNMSIGQGFVLVTPLQMACFVASVARDEVWTQPTLLHRPDAPRQRHPSIGLTPAQRAAVIEGMVGCTEYGTGARVFGPKGFARVPGVTVAGKTGTAQIPGRRNAAWFICFAPAERPEIAVAVMIEGDTAGESYEGGLYAAPVAGAVLKTYFEKKSRPSVTPRIGPFRKG